MKKSLYAIIVVILSALGASALAAKIDMNVEKVTIETSDKSGNDNGAGSTGVRNNQTRER